MGHGGSVRFLFAVCPRSVRGVSSVCARSVPGAFPERSRCVLGVCSVCARCVLGACFGDPCRGCVPSRCVLALFSLCSAVSALCSRSVPLCPRLFLATPIEDAAPGLPKCETVVNFISDPVRPRASKPGPEGPSGKIQFLLCVICKSGHFGPILEWARPEMKLTTVSHWGPGASQV